MMDNKLQPLVVVGVALLGLALLVWVFGGPRTVFAQMCGGGMHGGGMHGGGMHGGEGMRGESVPEEAPSHGRWHHVRMHGFDWDEAAEAFDKERSELTSMERGKFAVEVVCSDCHGKGGSGGVKNPNYEKGNVPRLDTLAESVGLFDKEKAREAIDLLKSGADLQDLRSDPPFDGFTRFSVQIQSIREVIRDGSEAAPEDPEGADPVDMPAWGRVLSDREIDGIIAYLLSLQEWDEDAKEEQ